MVDLPAVGDRLKDLCLALPETSETRTFGHLTFRVGKKTFAVLEEYGGQPCITAKVTKPHQETLLFDDRYFKAPYVGQHGWVGLRVAGNLDWDEVEALILESYRLNATKRALTALEEARQSSRGEGGPPGR